MPPASVVAAAQRAALPHPAGHDAVRDLRRSADWYRELFEAQEHSYTDDGGVLRQVTLSEPSSGLQLCLVTHLRDPDNIQLEFFWSSPVP
jgi:catechol 2,3-dioxygenase-like lactoylglutathione lyase family enzyme